MRECIVLRLPKQYLREISWENWRWSWIKKTTGENGRSEGGLDFLPDFIFVDGHVLGLLSLSGAATSCLQCTTVSNIILTYRMRYRNISFSWPHGWRAQSCSYNCAGKFLNKKPEPDLYQQCASLCRFAGWSSWWPVIPQESCRFCIILSYWCADSPARDWHLLYSEAYRPSLTWWWAM